MRDSRLSEAVQAASASGRAAQALVINAQPAEDYARFAETVTRVQWQAVVAAQIGTTEAQTAIPDATTDLAIVHHTRNRAETLGLIARAAKVAPGGVVVVDGTKADGIEGTLRTVSAAAPVLGRVSRSHGKAFWFASDALDAVTARAWTEAAAPRPNRDGWLTAPGMFSFEGVDPASEMLAAAFAGKLTGACADLGAGWGYLSARALDAGASHVDLFEADHRALAAAKQNLAGRPCNFAWADVSAIPSAASYDHVVTNPPFHDSARADPSIGQAFITASRGMVSPNGTLWLVANRHLPYESALEAAFGTVTRIAADGRFKVFAARNPRPAIPTRRRRR